MKTRVIATAAAVVVFLALSAVSVVILRGLGVRYRLEARNDAEQTMNVLFASLRDRDEFGTAIESDERLKDKVLGIGLYDQAGTRLSAWGETPAVVAVPSDRPSDEGGPVRKYVENSAHSSLVLLLRPWPAAPPHPRGGAPSAPPSDAAPPPPRSFPSDPLRRAHVVSLEIREPLFWRRVRTLSALAPVVEVVLAAMVASVASLVVRNSEYRKRFERERNLVMLGTAASTIAHELKNPLLSIRLQTSILARTVPESSSREIDIINAEVSRLAELGHRVNDYLRDEVGVASVSDPADVAAEVGKRLCGRDIATRPPVVPRVFMDPERLRSIIENLTRNALESGGPEADVAIEVSTREGHVLVDVLDRGAGVAPEIRERAFDPFYTTKSRGTGIGLAICRRFAYASGGTIALEERPGGGCRARLTLPEAPRRLEHEPGGDR